MHPADIQAALKKRGSSQTKIAATAKVTPAHVSYVIVGRTKSRRIANLISQATGISVDRLWPGKYIASDNRIAA